MQSKSEYHKTTIWTTNESFWDKINVELDVYFSFFLESSAVVSSRDFFPIVILGFSPIICINQSGRFSVKHSSLLTIALCVYQVYGCIGGVTK